MKFTIKHTHRRSLKLGTSLHLPADPLRFNFSVHGESQTGAVLFHDKLEKTVALARSKAYLHLFISAVGVEDELCLCCCHPAAALPPSEYHAPHQP